MRPAERGSRVTPRVLMVLCGVMLFGAFGFGRAAREPDNVFTQLVKGYSRATIPPKTLVSDAFQDLRDLDRWGSHMGSLLANLPVEDRIANDALFDRVIEFRDRVHDATYPAYPIANLGGSTGQQNQAYRALRESLAELRLERDELAGEFLDLWEPTSRTLSRKVFTRPVERLPR